MYPTKRDDDSGYGDMGGVRSSVVQRWVAPVTFLPTTNRTNITSTTTVDALWSAA